MTCEPQLFSKAPFTSGLLHDHRWNVCLYRGQRSVCLWRRSTCQGVTL